MRFTSKIAVLLGLLIVPACASSIAIIGGTYYAPQYDFAEFFAATDGRNFQVILVGKPFPGTDPNTVARDQIRSAHVCNPRPPQSLKPSSPLKKNRPSYREELS